jgi:hypothetical protein
MFMLCWVWCYLSIFILPMFNYKCFIVINSCIFLLCCKFFLSFLHFEILFTCLFIFFEFFLIKNSALILFFIMVLDSELGFPFFVLFLTFSVMGIKLRGLALNLYANALPLSYIPSFLNWELFKYGIFINFSPST